MNLSLFTSRDYPRAIVTHARQRSLDRRSMSRCTWRSRQTKICGIVGYQLITLIFGSRHVAVSRYRGIYIAIVPFCTAASVCPRVHVCWGRASPFLVVHLLFPSPPPPIDRWSSVRWRESQEKFSVSSYEVATGIRERDSIRWESFGLLISSYLENLIIIERNLLY